MGSVAPPGVTVLAELARGGRSVVYRVRRDDRTWAMKVFPVVSGTGHDELAALRREAAVIAWTGHPAFPRVQEVGVADRHPYLIMELIEGRSLAETLRAGPLGAERTARLGARVAGALAALHGAGLVHRDVKPQNIMLPPDGARLVDLGMAGRAATAATGAAGTLRYCPPEQAGTLDRPVDGRSDLYALGGVLFECLTGRPPFPGGDAGELLRAHAHEIPPEVPGPLGPVVARLLAKDPDDRYQSGTQLAADLGFPAAARGPDLVPLTGRDRELAVLAEWVRGARGGAGGFAVVAGGRGTGRSRLLHEAAARARRDGLRVFTGACPEEPRPLAPLLGAVESGAERGDRPEGGAPDSADGLISAARDGGLLLCLDDANRADEATLAVLRRLTAGIGQVPLLVLLAVDDADRLPAVVSRAADPVVTLAPLDPAALVAACAHGRGLGPDLLDRLATRAGNTPFEVREYLHSVIDSGVLTPYWGRWKLDHDGLDRIVLSGDLQALVVRRAEGLAQRDVLAAAAVIGTRFPAHLAAVAAGCAEADARRQLAEAVARRVVRREGDGYAFAHDRLRTWLLDTTEPALRRDAHQRVAEHLDRTGGDVYAIARHYLDGHPDRYPRRVVRACLAAGRLALDGNAPGQALTLLEPAAAMPPAGAEVGELLGTAYYRVGHLSDAVRVLTAALPAAAGPVARARILLQLSRVHQDTWDTEAGLAAVRRGLAELGRALPRGRAGLAGSTLVRFLAGLVVERTGLGFGSARGDAAARYRLEAQLYRCGGTVASLGLDPLYGLALLLRSVYPVTRLGLCEDYVRVRADVAGVLQVNRLLRQVGGGYRRPAAAARRLGDESAIAYVSGTAAACRHIAGRGRARDILADTADPQRRLDAATFVTALGGTLWLLVLAGLTADAGILYREGLARLAAADLPEHSLLLAGAAVAAAQGRTGDAEAVLRGVDDTMAAFRHPSPRVTLLLARAQVAVESHDLGDDFDRVVADLAELGQRPSMLLVPLRSVYAYVAYGRLAQGRDLPAARRAVATLREAACSTLLRAHARVCEAHLRLLDGDPAGALRILDRARPVLREAGAPLAGYEAARVRARALHTLGDDEAAAAAAGAHALAVRHGWPHRARWVRDEFGDTLLPDAGPAVAADDATYRQRLAAVTTLSLAASRITDPGQLTRVVLDETIRLLSAERAYLFLAAGDGTLRPHLGRDNTGADLEELAGYGATLVERARHSREPLVVAGTDEAAVLGSQSVVAYGLRSVLVSPLIHDDRLLGVLYLDSRVAEGIFTPADVGVLAALASHIAAALETARAAELAGNVRELGARVDQMQRLDSLGQLAGGIAHDFNNVLGIIAGFTELLRDELPAGSPLADQIASAVDKGTALTRQLLTFGRGQPGTEEVHDLGEIVTELDPMLRRTLGGQVSLRIDAGAGPPCLARVDRGRLEQVIVNLAANARDAMPDGGDLSITLGHDGPRLRLAVSDSGTGMDEEALARAFEPFYTTKPAGKGTGLGLASVYSIVRDAGGEVCLDSQVGRGTTVNVYLPGHGPAARAGSLWGSP